MDKFEIIKQFKDLLDTGIITQEEFNEEKAKLLNDDSDRNHHSVSVDENNAKEINPIDNNEKNVSAEKPTSVISPDSDGAIIDDRTVVFEKEPDQQANNDTKGNSVPKIPKPALIGIVVVLFVVFAFLLFPKNDAKEIQGSWDMVVITTDGQSSYPVGPIGGSLEISGDKWTMEIHSLTQDSSWSGKVKLDSKETTEDGTEGYFYDFSKDEGSLKAVYVPKNGLMTVSTHSYMDTDNCATFKKNN